MLTHLNVNTTILLTFEFYFSIYCENCISYFCGSSGFEQIKNVEMWNCYACNDTKVVPSGLERRSTDEQLHNVTIKALTHLILIHI